ncbi:tRNA (34-2'-O)-methyltransferase regulator WDR6 [Aplochiton taeniatus]
MMETVALIAPVTALQFLGEQYLLTGEGPILSVYLLQPAPKLSTSLSVLYNYRIHGIRPRTQPVGPECSSVPGQKDYELVVFGGKALRLVNLVHLDCVDQPHLEAVGPLVELHDWALDVCWASGNGHTLVGVALAHNSVLLMEPKEGRVLGCCSSLEGCLLYSALLLVDTSWVDSVLVAGTVFNQLVLWTPGRGAGDPSDQKVPVQRRLLGHSGVIFSISYLKEKGWLASASDDRSVRVWGVGALGGPGGMCEGLDPTCLRVLYGHQARVFSVQLSPGKVLSAGEDGTCLVWDWEGGGRVARTLNGHRAGGVRALAVSEGGGDGDSQGRWVATGGADGGVRLWRLKLGETEEREGDTSETITDLGFKGLGVPKVVSVVREECRQGCWSQGQLLVGTDQGVVYLYEGGRWKLVWAGGPEFHSYCVMDTLTLRTSDSLSKASLCAVGNLGGGVQVFLISQPQSGVFLSGGPGKIHSLFLVERHQRQGQGGYLLASGSNGLVSRWYIELDIDGHTEPVLRIKQVCSFVLPHSTKRWLTAVDHFHHPLGVLWVCGDRRGSLLLFQETEKERDEQEESVQSKKIGTLYSNNESNHREGKMNGEIAENKEEERTVKEGEKDADIQPVACLFGVHGKQGVTWVCQYGGLLYSAGRDGCVRVFRIRPEPLNKENDNGELQLEVLRVQRACKGMEWLERVLILETEHGDLEVTNHNRIMGRAEEVGQEHGAAAGSGKEARFVIAGFHSVHFVVWDPVTQERLLAVSCGGGHRSWSLLGSQRGLWLGYGTLIFIKQGTILASQPPGEEPNWEGRGVSWGLREGIHGKGIGSVCRLGRLAGDGTGVSGHWEVLVTGGEDTSLTVLAVHPETGIVKVLSVITDHISSVRTLTAIFRSHAGERRGRGTATQSLTALLFSAGGRAQMQCYRLLIGWDAQRQLPSCQVIQVASHQLDEQWERKRNRHKTVKRDPETRYMSIAVVDDTTACLLLAVAGSDGVLRLFRVSEERGQFSLLWESFFHQRCVLSVASCCLKDGVTNRQDTLTVEYHLLYSNEASFCQSKHPTLSLRNTLLFSAATDGRIAVWDMTTAASSLDGNSAVATVPATPCLAIPAHQSGVNSLAVWCDGAGWSLDSHLVTVASGGDDGQLTVSVVKVQCVKEEMETSEGSLQPRFVSLKLQLQSQCSVPLAHAAPLTALRLLSPGLLVSTSPDQRVGLWRISSVGLCHQGGVYSHVADAAGLAVWQEGDEGQLDSGIKAAGQGKRWIVVCGQGLQLFQVSQKKMDDGIERSGSKRCVTEQRVKGTFLQVASEPCDV